MGPAAAFPGPISRLSEEIFHHIFSMNTISDQAFLTGKMTVEGPSSFNALDTARHTSQVCRRWREWMLSSATIWGESLILESLDQKSDNWRDVVFARTGNARLSAVGNLRAFSPSTKFFLDTVLGEHWERLERLYVRVEARTDYLMAIVKDPRWNFLTLPAPNLRIFNVKFWHTPPAVKGPLFGNAAPRLHAFLTHGLHFTSQDFSLKNLEWLAIIANPLVTADMFDLLSGMRRLQYLRLGDVEEQNVVPSSIPMIPASKIDLPSLKNLKMTKEIRFVLFWLSNMSLPRGCAMHLSTYVDMPAKDVRSGGWVAVLFPHFVYVLWQQLGDVMSFDVMRVSWTRDMFSAKGYIAANKGGEVGRNFARNVNGL